MTEREKEVTDKLAELACEELKKVIGTDNYYRRVDSIELIIKHHVQTAFWVGMQHVKQQAE